MIFTSAGIRSLRIKFSQYLKADKPIAITRHKQTVGYLIPSQSMDKQKCISTNSFVDDELTQKLNELFALLAKQSK